MIADLWIRMIRRFVPRPKPASANRPGRISFPSFRNISTATRPKLPYRAKAIIGSFGWMNQGSMLLSVEGGSQAERMGLLPGDVIVKVDDVPVQTHLTLGEVLGPNPSVIYVWRAGHARSFKTAGGKLGTQNSNWQISHGGNDHARGIAAFERQAARLRRSLSRRLKAAHEQGMDDPHSLTVLTGLAARALDRAYAAKVYAENHEHEDWTASHDIYDIRIGKIPYDSPQCESLLKRFREEPFSVTLYNEAEDYFARYGRNGPMVEGVLLNPGPFRRWRPGTFAGFITNWPKCSSGCNNIAMTMRLPRSTSG